MQKIEIVAEIGINHNGNIDLAKTLIKLAKESGCDYAKIQKRNPDKCIPEDQKYIMRNIPELGGNITYIDYKNKIEFNDNQIAELFKYAKSIDMKLFASVWDIDSVDLMKKYTNIGKIPSALITDITLCKYARDNFKTLIVSTGMSTEDEVVTCIEACDPDIILHTNSTYPCPTEDLNLRYIEYLQQKYSNKRIGYSGHEQGLITTFATAALKASMIERHFTLSRELWGSDQKASLEPNELKQLVDGVRMIEKAMQYKPAPRMLFEKENLKKKSLRK